jgi:hypothetical protein
MLFTASWGPPSTRVQRPDGAYRRKYLVTLLVPSEHRELNFSTLRSAALCLQGDRPAFVTEDIEGVASRDLSSVTIAMYVDDWQ